MIGENNMLYCLIYKGKVYILIIRRVVWWKRELIDKVKNLFFVEYYEMKLCIIVNNVEIYIEEEVLYKCIYFNRSCMV